MASALQLRNLQAHDGKAFHRLLAQLPGDTPTFLHGHRAGMQFVEYMEHLHTRRTEAVVHDARQVPETLLFAFLADDIIGRVSIRHRLTPALEQLAGHIGYAVLPPWRGRGCATAMLGASVAFARKELGLEQLIITCDGANRASRRVIEKNGGRYLGSIAVGPGNEKRRYRIDSGAALHLQQGLINQSLSGWPR